MLKEWEHFRGGSQHLIVGKVIVKSYHCRGLSKGEEGRALQTKEAASTKALRHSHTW